MSNLPIGLQRLLQLADHLEHGKLGHAKFDFQEWHRGGSAGQCGSAGCALGECPFIWPDRWCFDGDFPALQDGRSFGPLIAAGRWFEIDEDEAVHLFIPARQKPRLFGGVILSRYVPKEKVAANIRAFVEISAKSLNQQTAQS